MRTNPEEQPESTVTYFVDEAGDGVLFGRKGRDRLGDPDASKYFMLGMVRCAHDAKAAVLLEELRHELQMHPLYATIPSMQAVAGKTHRQFHAKDDHPEIRAKVSLVHDVDDPCGKRYGSYLTRQGPPPDPEAIKIR